MTQIHKRLGLAALILLAAPVIAFADFAEVVRTNLRVFGDLVVSGGDVTGANGESVNIGSTDATFKLSRNTAGTVTLTAADDDATAAMSILPGGAAAFGLGGASTTAITVTTDSTGDGEVILPADSIGVLELTAPGRGFFTICGDATTVNNNIIYYGPSDTLVAGYGQTCDITAAGSATEATADAPAFTAFAFNVVGMECRGADNDATLSFTLRSAEAATVPSVTCSYTDNQRNCVANVQTTTAIASGATVAIAVASSSDIGATKGFMCKVFYSF